MFSFSKQKQPIQGLFGCPVHLCWWPLLDDMVYYKGAYYFFQNRWMFRMVDGQRKAAPSFDVEHVYDLRAAHITQHVYGAFNDYHKGALMLVVKRNGQYHACGLAVSQAEGGSRVTLGLNSSLAYQLDGLPPNDKVMAAVFLADTVWIAARTFEDKVVVSCGEDGVKY